jgi:hypothetical protein
MVLNFVLFFVFLAVPYYFVLGVEHYVPKSSPVWGFFSPNSPEAWFFFALAFAFLALWAVTLELLLWKRPDLAQKGTYSF